MCHDFEIVWRDRKSYLKDTPGFISFTFLRSLDVVGEYTSQTVWENHNHFKAWMDSPQFEQSHRAANTELVRSSLEQQPTISFYEGLYQQ
jgi:heme-degrading monooxygenase HmoA